MKELIEEFLSKSEKMRPGYLDSLYKSDPKNDEKLRSVGIELPQMFFTLYSMTNGTPYDISEQKYFDFLPGFRLMQIDEILAEIIYNTYNDETVTIVPFLADYSGCRYAYEKRNGLEKIVYISDEGIDILHDSVEDFWLTINAFYDEEVYYTDDDGYLSYDLDKEGEIGRKYNKFVDFWKD